ncbi:hypothetical protein DCS_07053 [Drechmeria coniospora]|uniref:Uncharacterized protein n=1 Tax=Drechmeria coniospora TaxID=98403 RepID=A0A151GDE8_DRECN|nr:hypothetical protein DCS_07053 [Drechmeria coniospora]KYK55091.1 hypothetical protein DCS_07053 [Drechmeria coniospora]ODA82284.1 hypothetical protein RJ55_00791 [Drechmeria coniospora]
MNVSGLPVLASHGPNSTPASADSTPSQAQALLKVAQAESREHNLCPLASSRRNTYELREGGTRSSTLIQDDGLLKASTHGGTNVNATIGAAL